MSESQWHRLGRVDELKTKPLQSIQAGKVIIALSYRDGEFGAIAGLCNHVGGPLGDGQVNAEGYVVCPPRYDLKTENGDLFVNLVPATKRVQAPHPAHPLTRPITRAPGPIRVVGISTSAMNRDFPRYSTSEALLQAALDHAAAVGHETKLIRLNDLNFRACEGYYSISADACTWPCTITQMDDTDQLTCVYEALVFWADVVLVSTSIRWGAPSSLYFKMIERMNCIQNQVTIRDRVLIRNKIASFIITGGQDNIQAVAGQMLVFFGELGFLFPQFPFIAHSRGWTAEDMEQNVAHVQASEELRQGAQALVDRCVALAADLIAAGEGPDQIERGGRKAHPAP